MINEWIAQNVIVKGVKCWNYQWQLGNSGHEYLVKKSGEFLLQKAGKFLVKVAGKYFEELQRGRKIRQRATICIACDVVEK